MTRAIYYILENGEPREAQGIIEWGIWFENKEKRKIAQDTVKKDVMVSTVFLGIDHNFSGEGPPILFETLVFGGEFDGDMDRYCTMKEALAGHQRMVEMVRTGNSIVHDDPPPTRPPHKRKLRIQK